MPSPAPSLTFLVLVDALRPDYLQWAPYLRSLAAESATGALRECFGFVPRQAYFGGLAIEDYGYTNMYSFDPEASPFGLARFLPTDPAGEPGREAAGARALVEQSAAQHLTAFARQYASSVEIPLAYLPSFDLVEKRAPWDKHVGYRSCFHLFDERGLPWLQCMWPDTNRLPDRSDAGIVNHVLQSLRPEHRFACVHLQQLDGLGHVHGPNSSTLQHAIRTVDALCRRLVEGAREGRASFRLILFGDHGMVNVTRTLDLGPVLKRTGLSFGADYAYFLDSTMARFWFRHESARRIVTEALAGVAGGRMLDAAGMKQFGIDRCARQNAEAVFLADPGVLIFPNFFQASGEPIPGMHGYDPDCEDNLGLFLLHDRARPELAGADLGRVNPPSIYPLILEGTGFSPAEFTHAPLPAPIGRIARPGRFTRCSDPAAEQVVSDHLAAITAAVRQRVGEVEAIVLTGGFGRGEGGMHRDAAGQWRPVNDYDLLVVDRRDLRAALAGLGDELAPQLGLDFVDLGYSDGRWEKLPLTLFHYDLKHGSQVVAGDPRVLDRVPAYASADIPVFEMLRLMLNRTAGLLSGLRGEFLQGVVPTPDQQRYLANQVTKLLIAIGDWYLWQWRGYDCSYARRRRRFAALALGAGLPAELRARIDAAYAFKCEPDYAGAAFGLADIAELQPHLETALIAALNQFAEIRARTLEVGITGFVEAASSDRAAVQSLNAAARQHPRIRDDFREGTLPEVAVRDLTFGCLPLLVQSAFSALPGAGFAAARQLLGRAYRVPAEESHSPAAWERLRELAVRSWFALVH